MIEQQIDMQLIAAIARKAGEAIMDIYQDEIIVEIKENNSPLTQADRAANQIIISELKKAYPGIPYISEETKTTEYERRKTWNYCWLIDPIDGTKEFIKRNGEFTVNIALVENAIPVAGVVYAPALQKMWMAKKNEGGFLISPNEVKTRLVPGECYTRLQNVRVIASRSHLNDDTRMFIQNLKNEGKEIEFVSAGSSLKFCLLAEGAADVYPRFAPTMEWDTAAGHAILSITGGFVNEKSTTQPLVYNKPDLLNPYFLAHW